MKEKYWMMPKELKTKIIRAIKNEFDSDDIDFNIWKSELQKELPSFWESMNR